VAAPSAQAPVPGVPPAGVFGARAAPREVAVAPAEPISGRASARPVPAAPAPEVSARPSAGERGGMGRGASRGRQEREVAIYTRPSKDFDKRGNFGNAYRTTSNYFEVLKRPDWHLMQYRVDFVPDIDHMGVRKALVRQHESKIGKYIFDGTLLYCVKRVAQPWEEVSTKTSDPTNPIKVSLRLVGEIQKDDQMYIVIMNIIFRRCLGMLNLTEIRRDFYDSEAVQIIQQHNLRIWPGYLTSIRQHEEQLLLGVEIIFKVLRGDTALDVMAKIRQQGGDFRAACKAELEGKVVMTAYNKRTYRIDDIDFDKNPKTKFNLRKENRDVTYLEYYRSRYNVTIRSETQPMLISRPTRKDKNRGDDEPIFLVPELCGMTGLTDDMRKNYTVMKDVGDITRLKPDSRVNSLMRFNKRLMDHPEIMKELNSWGLKFSSDLVECKARMIPPQTIVQSGSYPAQNGDWSNSMRRQRMAVTTSLRDWIAIYPSQMEAEVKQFVEMFRQVGRDMGFDIPNPKIVSMTSDRSNEYTNRIREECGRLNANIVMAVMRSQRADTYGAIKKLTCSDLGIPSQVITGRILKGAPGKLRSIATKVMIQVAAKLGAEPWRVQVPKKDWMVCGYDTYHDARQRKAVGAFVASINCSFTRYASNVSIHENNEEISPSFNGHLMKVLRCYYKANSNTLPGCIFVYRDGVGAGDIARIKTIEIHSLKEACRQVGKALSIEYTPKIAYIVVSKRINTRFFGIGGPAPVNPPPGLVVDNTVTLSERFDFFLISQSVTQGSVSPTSYNIVEDETRTTPDTHQRLAYALTHLYYNWAGTLRVPAPCQYAHKLAYLVGESINALPHDGLANLPYYL